MANVLRRLRRIAEAYGTAPRFVLASATIANPAELAERLTGLEDFAVVDRDGSPGARRTVAMWNPPIVDEQLAKGISIEEHPVKRAISTQPVVKPIKITAPNSVFALGAAFSK